MEDTPAEILRLQARLLARRTPRERQMLAYDLSARVITDSQRAIRELTPGDEIDALARWVSIHHGPELGEAFAKARRERDRRLQQP